MKNVIVCCCISAALTLPVSAQPKQWSLRECCDYAVANNISMEINLDTSVNHVTYVSIVTSVTK